MRFFVYSVDFHSPVPTVPPTTNPSGNSFSTPVSTGGDNGDGEGNVSPVGGPSQVASIPSDGHTVAPTTYPHPVLRLDLVLRFLLVETMKMENPPRPLSRPTQVVDVTVTQRTAATIPVACSFE
jgi:hypothetical protein